MIQSDLIIVCSIIDARIEFIMRFQRNTEQSLQAINRILYHMQNRSEKDRSDETTCRENNQRSTIARGEVSANENA